MDSVCIHYFVPELGETEAELNGYLIPRPPNGVSLDLVRSSFPLQGARRFRALCKYNKERVFLDLVRDDQLVPDFNGRIVLKVALGAKEVPKPAAQTVDFF